MIDTMDAYYKRQQSKLNTLTADELSQLLNVKNELKRLRRIHRAETDLLYFAWEYFSEVANPENDGNWDGFDLPNPEAGPQFHKEICEIIDEVSTVKRNAKVAVAAPRSHAKSSYLSKASPLRETVFRKRRYIILISETPTVATGNLEWLANQLKSNKKLRDDFGPLLSPKQQMNPKDNSVEFIAWEQQVDEQKQLTLIQAASTGQALRGRNWNGTRPDMVVCDDLEDLKSNAGTKEQREKLKDWFSQVVMPLGDPKGLRTAFIYMGTVVHAESLLNNVIKNRADFTSTLYKALIEEPERTDLWEQCRAIYLDDTKTPKERADAAEAFYLANRTEMDRGAVVLWPEAQPIWRLMQWKWDNGSKAFNTEYQNTPLDEESQIFILDKLRYFDASDLFDTQGNPLPLDYYAFWDIAMGKSNRSDYNAIVTVGRDRRTGIMYVVDAWAKKCPAHIALEEAVNKIIQFGHKTFGIETVGAQHDLYRQLQEKLAKQGVYGTKLKPIISRKKKEERIEALEPLTENGFLRFMNTQRLLLEQMEQFPNATHDDLPDALAGAVDLAGGTRPKRRKFYSKPYGL
ncbi:phage terminase large subunit [Aneurinibacillus aneurinilyticus]|uniref:phage terminase large subunit n=1 Tax=Aneurinibacillus aneurinilyticus TaxID=1391 RepID=UPI0023F32C40|nr:phage terminase large subunit [Aneurinibacillus aneurinilyticus]